MCNVLIRIVSLFMLVGLLNAQAADLQVEDKGTQCAKGVQTSLSIQVNKPTILHHDQPIGMSKLTLRAEPSGEVLLSTEMEGQWFCIGYNKQTKRYLLGGINELGSWLPLASIQILTDVTQAIRHSS